MQNSESSRLNRTSSATSAEKRTGHRSDLLRSLSESQHGSRTLFDFFRCYRDIPRSRRVPIPHDRSQRRIAMPRGEKTGRKSSRPTPHIDGYRVDFASADIEVEGRARTTNRGGGEKTAYVDGHVYGTRGCSRCNKAAELFTHRDARITCRYVRYSIKR